MDQQAEANILVSQIPEYYIPPVHERIYMRLFALSSLEFCFFSELVMLMFAHLFLAPFFDVSHSSTSS